MDWIKEFYEKQGEWSREPYGPIGEMHRERVKNMERLIGSGPHQVLELGAGGGQFAAAAAAAGHHVAAVEIVPALARHIEKLSKETYRGSLMPVTGDFYQVELNQTFDVVCYWDGFGVGFDDDQKRLLKRIEGWLKPGGYALIDIYTPWYWANAAGRGMSFGSIERVCGFDARACRMEDTWWQKGEKDRAVTQSLRCYAPVDLELLLQGLALSINQIEPGGAFDYDRMEYIERVPLAKAMTYLVKLVQG